MAATARRALHEFTVIAWDAPGAGRSTDPPERFGLDGYARCLAAFIEKLRLDSASVAGLSFGGILALALQRRHAAMSSALILASAYAGWGGSLPPEVAEQRLRQALGLADGTPGAFVAALLPTMLSKTMPRETVDDFRVSMQAFHPRGFRAMAQASAEDVRDVLPHIDVPTLLLYGERDVRAPLAVAEPLHAAVSGSKLVVVPDAGISATSKLRTSTTSRSGTSSTTTAARTHRRAPRDHLHLAASGDSTLTAFRFRLNMGTMRVLRASLQCSESGDAATAGW